jgi:disulfide bond formation protein DsbB
MEVTNPYAAPSAPVADSPERHYYTPGQVTLATLLGGPLAGGYLFSRNYSLFGSPKKAKNALLWSFAVSVAAIGLGFALPAHTSRTVPAAIVAGMYRWYAKDAFQETIAERQAQCWLRYSWWRVVGLSVAFLVLIVVLAAVLLILTPWMLFGRSLV